VVYRSSPTQADAQFADAKSGVTDIFGLDNALYAQQKDQIPAIHQVAYVDPCPRAVWFNHSKAPFNNGTFDRALSMTMNRAKWAANIWIPPSKPAAGLWSDYRNLDQYINTGSDTKWHTLDYDPQAAVQLMATIGYTQVNGQLMDASGKQVSFVVGTPTQPTDFEYKIAQDWIQDLKAIGINASVQNFQQPPWFNNVNAGTWDTGVWWFCGATVDPMELYSQFLCKSVVPVGTNATVNAERYCDKNFDTVVNQLMAITPNDPKAAALYQQAFDLWMQDPPGVPLIQTYYTAYYNDTYWSNMPTNSNLYTVPFNWWGQIMWVYFNVKPK
jgi:peptide/nickel transport system substrate-binding protein